MLIIGAAGTSSIHSSSCWIRHDISTHGSFLSKLRYKVCILLALRNLAAQSRIFSTKRINLALNQEIKNRAHIIVIVINNITHALIDCLTILTSFRSKVIIQVCKTRLNQLFIFTIYVIVEVFIFYFLQFPIRSDYIFILHKRSSALVLRLLVSILTYQSLNLPRYCYWNSLGLAADWHIKASQQFTEYLTNYY